MKVAKCRVCTKNMSLVLDPFESFKVQYRRLFGLFCSAFREKNKQDQKQVQK